MKRKKEIKEKIKELKERIVVADMEKEHETAVRLHERMVALEWVLTKGGSNG